MVVLRGCVVGCQRVVVSGVVLRAVTDSGVLLRVVAAFVRVTSCGGCVRVGVDGCGDVFAVQQPVHVE